MSGQERETWGAADGWQSEPSSEHHHFEMLPELSASPPSAALQWPSVADCWHHQVGWSDLFHQPLLPQAKPAHPPAWLQMGLKSFILGFLCASAEGMRAALGLHIRRFRNFTI